MRANHHLKRLGIIPISGLAFLAAYLSPLAYAQISRQNAAATPAGNHSSIFYFSGGLLAIALCVVFVLYFNRAQGQQVDEKARFEFQRLSFAAVVLTGLGLIFLLSMAMYYWAPSSSEAGKTIFEACKTVIPPIITLVLGYYFGKSDQVQTPEEKHSQARTNGQRETGTDKQVSPEISGNDPNRKIPPTLS